MSAPLKMYEKLCAFYLGRGYDLDEREIRDDVVLYDSKDLVTHAVLVGMTGSGKTGLGVTILEEAAIDQIPALVVDPKGDMANLMLTFPELRPDDFQAWVNADDARRQDMSAAEFAAQQAETWRQGLLDWDQDGTRIQRLRESAEFTIYTPGSNAGVPVSILSSFAAPSKQLIEDGDLFRDRVVTAATSLLSLLGIDADPVRSREHILLTTVFDQAWRKRQSLDLAAIIRLVQDPPVDRIGVMDLDSFFPPKDRFEFAMTINNLLAAPGFSAWLTGEPLDVDRLLHTPEGKPRISIFSIAHLSDSERMFFLSLLLNEILGWMRTRPGTSTLRALLYIDEIFGFMPPVAEPATKKPLLTLLKQARAFGVGLVLATQNPADLDYKGLSNTGTWFIGRLQTERDKKRVLDGLEGATNDIGGTFDRSMMSQVLSRVGKRVFLLHNVHEVGPTVFHTRWALSYLSGPMARGQIKKLMAGRQPSVPDTQQLRQSADVVLGDASSRPLLSPDVTQVFLPIQRHAGAGKIVYQPHLVSVSKVHFVDTRKGLSADEELTLLVSLKEEPRDVDWSQAEELALWQDDFASTPESFAGFGQVPSSATKKKHYSVWKKSLSEHLYRSRRQRLFKSVVLREFSQPGETERDFRIRLGERAHELRDAALDKLRKKYASKLQTLENRIVRAEQKVDVERDEAQAAHMQTAISWGSTILSAVLGRKSLSRTIGRATTSARGMGRSRKQAGDVSRAEERLFRYQKHFEELEYEITQEQEIINDRFDPLQEELQTIQLKPRRTDIDIRTVALGWAPFVLHEDGSAEPLFT